MSAPTAPQPKPARITEIRLFAELEADRLAEQTHQLEDPATDAAFARLAIDHPDRCHHDSDYPGWQPGGAV